MFNCAKEVDTSAWSGLGASMHSADAEGLDAVVAGIEPFSEVCFRVAVSSCEAALLMLWCGLPLRCTDRGGEGV